MAAATAAGTAATRGCSAPLLWGRQRRQERALTELVTKHVQDPALAEVVSVNDFAPTSTERGVSHWEHSHIVAALDVLNAYQRDRRASVGLLGSRLGGFRRTYKQDPRTRFVELLKRWLRTQASISNINEDELRSFSGLCRDVLNHPKLFPSMNKQSFMKSLAEVYDHLQWQLREVLERDRTCAELAQRVLSLSRNFLSDSIVFLLLAPTDLKQTDDVPSLEVVALWQSLPTSINPLPSRADPVLQRVMRDAWKTRCGGLVAASLSTHWCVRLFDGAGAQEEAAATAALMECSSATVTSGGISGLISEAREDFQQKRFKHSGLAGVLRRPDMQAARDSYFTAVEVMSDLAYLLGEALVQFHRISDGLGDYGMIRVATWLHPFLEALTDKVQRLKAALEHLNETIERHVVMARARGLKVDTPSPSVKMNARAQNCIGRAIMERSSHAHSLLQALEELRARSAPERLPHLVEGLGDACTQLQAVMASSEFRARIGDSFPDLPPITGTSADVVSAVDNPSVDNARLMKLALEWQEDEALEIPTMQVASEAVVPTFGPACISNACIPKSASSSSPLVVRESVAGNPFDQDISLESGVVPGPFSDSDCFTSRERGLSRSSTRSTSCASTPTQYSDSPSDKTSACTSESSARTGDNVALPQFGSRRRNSSAPLRWQASDQQTSPVVQSPGSSIRSRSPAALLRRTPAVLPRAAFTGDDFQAEVYRLTTAIGGHGWRRHDRRNIRLFRGCLHIFNKGSTRLVKAVVDIERDVEDCSLISGGNVISLSLCTRAAPSPVVSGAGESNDVSKQKMYFFEFASCDDATTFYNEIMRLKDAEI